jgi:bisphosphoglycerate-dependent phosphoglycerate mutase
MISSERFQKVVFVRHGVAKHNLPDPSTGKTPNLRDPILTDPSLVYKGKQQALHAGHRLQEWWHATQHGNDIELVVTSVSTKLLFSSLDRKERKNAIASIPQIKLYPKIKTQSRKLLCSL